MRVCKVENYNQPSNFNISSINNYKKFIHFTADAISYKDADTFIKNDEILKIKNLNNLSLISEKSDTLLHSAAKHNNLEISKFLLSKNLNPNYKNSHGKTPFSIACTKNNPKLVENFLLYDIEINSKDNFNNTPLHNAATYPKIAKLLLENGANQYLINDFDETPFELSYKNIESLEIFLKHGTDPDSANSNNSTLMHKAIANANLHVADLLKAYNADVNYKDNNGKSPIFYTENPECIKWLHKNNANLNIQDKKGQTPIHISVINNDPIKAKELLKYKVNTNLYDNAQLPPIAYCKSIGMLKLLLNNSADPNTTIPSGTILHNYVKRNDTKAIDVLIKNNTNVNIPDDKGCVALDYAKTNEIRKLLLDAGSNPNYKNYLIYAIKTSNYEFFTNLLISGADSNNSDSKNCTPLFYVNNEQELSDLINYNADINHKNKAGYTPILHFALLGKMNFVEDLNSLNADLTPADNGDTLEDCIKKHQTYQRWLKKELPNNNLSFTGLPHYKTLGTESLRNNILSNITLSTDEIDEIITNAPTTDEGIKEAYLLLKNIESKITTNINDYSVIVKHFNFNAKNEIRKIKLKNPSGSKIPIIGLFRQYSDTVISDLFFSEIENCLNTIKTNQKNTQKHYYNNGIEPNFQKYFELNKYLTEGLEYIIYVDGSNPNREKYLKNLKTCKRNCQKRKIKFEENLKKQEESLDNIINDTMNYQKDKQSNRNARKVIQFIIAHFS